MRGLAAEAADLDLLGLLVAEEGGEGLGLLDLVAEERGRLKSPWRRR